MIFPTRTTMRYHNNMLCYCFTILRFMNDFQAIFSRKADVLYTIDVTYSHIFMNLVTNMRWGGQGVVGVVFSTRKRWKAMVLILLSGLILGHQTRRNQLAPPVPQLCPLVVVQGIQAQPVRQQCLCRACMNHTSMEATTIMMSTSSNSSTQASNYQSSIQIRAKGWRKRTAQFNSEAVVCWWINPKTGLLQFNEAWPGCVPAYSPANFRLYSLLVLNVSERRMAGEQSGGTGAWTYWKIFSCLKAIHSWLFVFYFRKKLSVFLRGRNRWSWHCRLTCPVS